MPLRTMMLLTRPLLVLGSLIPPDIEKLLHQYGWLALFALVLLQDVGVPTAIPGTVLVLFGGYLVFTGTINLHVAALSLAAGAFIGASGMFLLAQYGGRPVVLRIGKFIGLTEPRLDAAARSLERWGPPMLLLTRVAPGTRVYMTLFAGISGWTYRRFALWTGIFVLLWAYTFVIIGYALGERWEVIARFILRFGGVLVVLIILLVIAYAVNVYLTNRRSRVVGQAADPAAPDVGTTTSAARRGGQERQPTTTARGAPPPPTNTAASSGPLANRALVPGTSTSIKKKKPR